MSFPDSIWSVASVAICAAALAGIPVGKTPSKTGTVSFASAEKVAMAIFRPTTAEVAVYGLSRELSAGTKLGEDGPADIPGVQSAVVTQAVTGPSVTVRFVGKGLPQPGWAFWDDFYPGADYPHDSALVVVSAQTGRPEVALALAWAPLVDGAVPGFSLPASASGPERIYPPPSAALVHRSARGEDGTRVAPGQMLPSATLLAWGSSSPSPRRPRLPTVSARDFADECVALAYDEGDYLSGAEALSSALEPLKARGLRVAEASSDEKSYFELIDNLVGSGCRNLTLVLLGHGAPTPEDDVWRDGSDVARSPGLEWKFFHPFAGKVPGAQDYTIRIGQATATLGTLVKIPTKLEYSNLDVNKLGEHLSALRRKYPDLVVNALVESCFSGRAGRALGPLGGAVATSTGPTSVTWISGWAKPMAERLAVWAQARSTLQSNKKATLSDAVESAARQVFTGNEVPLPPGAAGDPLTRQIPRLWVKGKLVLPSSSLPSPGGGGGVPAGAASIGKALQQGAAGLGASGKALQSAGRQARQVPDTRVLKAGNDADYLGVLLETLGSASARLLGELLPGSADAAVGIPGVERECADYQTYVGAQKAAHAAQTDQEQARLVAEASRDGKKVMADFAAVEPDLNDAGDHLGVAAGEGQDFSATAAEAVSQLDLVEGDLRSGAGQSARGRAVLSAIGRIVADNRLPAHLQVLGTTAHSLDAAVKVLDDEVGKAWRKGSYIAGVTAVSEYPTISCYIG